MKVLEPRLYLIAKYKAENTRSMVQKLGSSMSLEALKESTEFEYNNLIDNWGTYSKTYKNELWRFTKTWAQTNKNITLKPNSVWSRLPEEVSHLG